MGRRRRRQKRKTGIGFLLFLVLAIFGTINIAKARLDDQRATLLVRQQELEQRIADAKEESSNIEELDAYVQTKKFIEETAREKLKLVYPDDILFKAED